MEECFVEQTLDVITKRILQREYARARFANVDEDALTLDAQLLGAKAAALLRQSGGVQLTDGVSEGVWWFARLFGAVLATIATFNKSLAESWLEHESTDAAYWPFTASAQVYDFSATGSHTWNALPCSISLVATIEPP